MGNACKKRFREIEPQDVFYRGATELIKNAKSDFARIDALSMLLQTWNKVYYAFNRSWKREDDEELARILKKYYPKLKVKYGSRHIKSLGDVDAKLIHKVFTEFTTYFGQTGAAKCLHLLFPNFFPIWD